MSDLERHLPEWLGLDDLLTLMAGLAVFLILLVIWSALRERDPLAKRVKEMKALRDDMRSDLLSNRRKTGGERKKAFDGKGFMQWAVGRLNLTGETRSETTTLMLARAGWRHRDAAVTLMFFKFLMPFVMGGMTLLYVKLLGPSTLKPMVELAIAMGATLLGAMLPGLYVRNAITKRQQALRKGLPDCLDLLVICAEAGLSLDAALTRVAREMARSSPDMADELEVTAVELGFLPDRRLALENLGRRTDMQSVRSVVNTLLQTEKYGTPLSQSLRVLATEFRSERMLRAEDKAARLPATLTVPMIIFILPALFVVLLGPAAIKALDALSKV
jgi:tight adherence protein C